MTTSKQLLAFELSLSSILTPSADAGPGQKKSVPKDGEIGDNQTCFIRFKRSKIMYDFIIFSFKN